MQNLKINQIAALIQQNWTPVNYAAAPYLEAMFELADIDDPYFCDNGRGNVARFVCNAGSWRGDVAREVKAELRRRLK